jgi:hypothetical protein
MEILVQQIKSALATQKECFVRPEELKRVWRSIADEKREHIVRKFATEHGWRIFTYNRVLGAMFVRNNGLNNPNEQPVGMKQWQPTYHR